MSAHKIISAALLCFLLSGCNKMTGGGWFFDFEGDRVSFGFQAQPVDEPTQACGIPDGPCVAAKGTLNLVDHGNVSGQPRQIRGEFTGTYTEQSPFDCEPEATFPCASQFEGTAEIDGALYNLSMRVTDNGEGAGIVGDFVSVFLEPIGGGDLIDYVSTIQRGNIQVHES